MLLKPQRPKAFTLLEVIIVIIIVAVLASLALPRMYRLVERSRATEAISQLSVLRSAFERCYLMGAGSASVWNSCLVNLLNNDDPSQSPNSHFNFGMASGGTGYALTANRNTRDLGMAPDCSAGDSIPNTGSSWSLPGQVVGAVALMGNQSGEITIKGYCAYDDMQW